MVRVASVVMTVRMWITVATVVASPCVAWASLEDLDEAVLHVTAKTVVAVLWVALSLPVVIAARRHFTVRVGLSRGV